MKRARPHLLFILPLLLLACPAPAPDPEPPTVASFLRDKALAECEHQARCLALDPAGCRDTFAAEGADGYLAEDASAIENEIAAGRLRFVPEAVADCLEAIRTESCRGSVYEVTGCRAALVPLVPPGGECLLVPGTLLDGWPFTECDGGWCDDGERCPGTCVATGVTPVGSACVLSRECVPDAACYDQVCVGLPGQGEPCTYDCASGLVCTPSSDTCERPAPTGAACASIYDCQSFMCVDGVCVEKVGLGDYCFFTEHCPEGSACLGIDFFGTGTCRVPHGTQEGETCWVQLDCAEGLFCDWSNGSVCAPEPPPAQVGESCRDADCVESAWCDRQDGGSPVCRARAALGEACEPSGCEPGLLCSGTGLCVEPAVHGEACGAGRPCRPDLRCIEGVCGDSRCVPAP